MQTSPPRFVFLMKILRGFLCLPVLEYPWLVVSTEREGIEIERRSLIKYVFKTCEKNMVECCCGLSSPLAPTRSLRTWVEVDGTGALKKF